MIFLRFLYCSGEMKFAKMIINLVFEEPKGLGKTRCIGRGRTVTACFSFTPS